MTTVSIEERRILQNTVVTLWHSLVYNNASGIDPDNQHDWESLFLGFALGQGLGLTEAHNLLLSGRIKL